MDDEFELNLDDDTTEVSDLEPADLSEETDLDDVGAWMDQASSQDIHEFEEDAPDLAEEEDISQWMDQAPLPSAEIEPEEGLQEETELPPDPDLPPPLSPGQQELLDDWMQGEELDQNDVIEDDWTSDGAEDLEEEAGPPDLEPEEPEPELEPSTEPLEEPPVPASESDEAELPSGSEDVTDPAAEDLPEPVSETPPSLPEDLDAPPDGSDSGSAEDSLPADADAQETSSAYDRMAEYMNGHNYGRDDYGTYCQDPEWQQLNRDLIEESGTQPSAASEMYLYMTEHNYSRMDYPEYSQDPEWQRINEAYLENPDRPVPEAEDLPAVEEVPETGETVPETSDAVSEVEEISEADEAAPVAEDVPETDVAGPETEEVSGPDETMPEVAEVPETEEVLETGGSVPESEEAAETVEAAPDMEDVPETSEIVPETSDAVSGVEEISEADEAAPVAEDVPETDVDGPETEEVSGPDETMPEVAEVPETEEVLETGGSIPESEEAAETVEAAPDTEDVPETVPETSDAVAEVEEISEADEATPVAEDIPETDVAGPETEEVSGPDETMPEVAEAPETVESVPETEENPDIGEIVSEAEDIAEPVEPVPVVEEISETGEAVPEAEEIPETGEAVQDVLEPSFEGYYSQGNNEHHFEGTCGPTSMATGLNRILGTSEFTEDSVLNEALQEGLCDSSQLNPADNGGMTVDNFMDLYRHMNDLTGNQLQVDCYEKDDVLSMEQVARQLDQGNVVHVTVDSDTLWQTDASGLMGTPAGIRDTDHWITVTDAVRGEDGSIQGFHIVDSGGGRDYVDAQTYQAMCYGTDQLYLTDPTCIVVSRANAQGLDASPEIAPDPSATLSETTDLPASGLPPDTADLQTCTLDADSFDQQLDSTLTSYEDQGYTVRRLTNSWPDPSNPFKTVTADLVGPDGQSLTLQFHTQESLQAMTGEMQKLYAVWKTLPEDSPEALDVQNQLFALSRRLKAPQVHREGPRL